MKPLLLISGRPETGYALSQHGLDHAQGSAIIGAGRKGLSLVAFPAGTFFEVTDFKIEFVSFDRHSQFVLQRFHSPGIFLIQTDSIRYPNHQS
ncbi:MAG: hypothetical protein ACOZF0_12555 [Thermodesulfobacteriota bacterium]